MESIFIGYGYENTIVLTSKYQISLGWDLKHRSHNELKKTVITYLPPIDSKVTDFSTIFAYYLLAYLQKLAADVNMPYVNIIPDVGAAVNTYKALWSQPS